MERNTDQVKKPPLYYRFQGPIHNFFSIVFMRILPVVVVGAAIIGGLFAFAKLLGQ